MMSWSKRLRNAAQLVWKVSAYNLKIIFAGRFAYFLLAAVLVFLGVTAIVFFDANSTPDAASVYNLLIFPGLLVIFYPTAFGIQNDVDARMIEILFGIPDYRYKVWLARMALIWAVVFAILIVLTVLSSLILVPVPLAAMVYQLMFPVFFIGSLSFMLSTLIRSGNGTAVVVVVVGTAFWFASGLLARSRWNLFLNPFAAPDQTTEAVWAGLILENRLMIAVGAVLAILIGLYNLQKREPFI